MSNNKQINPEIDKALKDLLAAAVKSENFDEKVKALTVAIKWEQVKLKVDDSDEGSALVGGG